jgi:hypothetical protein
MSLCVVSCRSVALGRVTGCGLDLAGSGEGTEAGFYEPYICTLRLNFLNRVTFIDSASWS